MASYVADKHDGCDESGYDQCMGRFKVIRRLARLRTLPRPTPWMHKPNAVNSTELRRQAVRRSANVRPCAHRTARDGHGGEDAARTSSSASGSVRACIMIASPRYGIAVTNPKLHPNAFSNKDPTRAACPLSPAMADMGRQVRFSAMWQILGQRGGIGVRGDDLSQESCIPSSRARSHNT